MKADAFQDFFADVMSRRYPGDFVRTRPWGSVGDKKNDGYLRSARHLFQVYAPNEMSAANAITKIEEDFAGALPHWEDYFDKWSFVHNARNGLGPEVLQCLLNLGKTHSQIDVSPWGFESLEKEVLALGEDDLHALLGHAPDSRSFSSVRSEDLLLLLEALAQSEAASDVDIRPISIEKIDKNQLGDDSKIYLRMGQHKSGMVKKLFDAFPNPLTGERIAQSFRDRYAELKAERLASDRILSELVKFAEGYGTYEIQIPDRQKHHAAAAAVVAYLFERCDIFEDPEVQA